MEHSEQITIFREVEFELTEEGDGRTLYTRIVPYNTPATVSDPPDFVPYQEAFVPGAFDKQLNAANRVEVFLNFEHQQGLGGLVGRGVHLDSREDGLYGQFRILRGNDGDKALELIADEVLTGMSLEATVLKSRRTDGVVWRSEARLRNAALCRSGIAAYKSAQVLAVRTEEEPQVADDPNPGTDEIVVPEPVVVRSDTDERLERLGISPITTVELARTAWDDSSERFTDEQYEQSCLVDLGGEVSPKLRCSLPVFEPTGELNLEALDAAAQRVGQVSGASLDQKAAAARRMLRLYRVADATAPDNVRQLATR